MKAAERPDQLVSGAQMKMIGVAEHDLRAGVPEVVGPETLDGPASADGHEDRRLHVAVRRPQTSAPRATIRRQEFKHALGHRISVASPYDDRRGPRRPPPRP